MGFKIAKGVLLKYTPERVDEIVIPVSVTSIGEEAFQAQSHILCKRKTVHFENIDHYDETGKKDVGLICILPRSCSSVKRG